MRNRCRILIPIVDQSRVIQLSVETTGPLPNTDICQCGSERCKRKRRHRR